MDVLAAKEHGKIASDICTDGKTIYRLTVNLHTLDCSQLVILAIAICVCTRRQSELIFLIIAKATLQSAYVRGDKAFKIPPFAKYTKIAIRVCTRRQSPCGRLCSSRQQVAIHVCTRRQNVGLLIFCNMIIPIVDRFPEDMKLNRMMTTKPFEMIQEEST